jgi:hypothetical protein
MRVHAVVLNDENSVNSHGRVLGRHSRGPLCIAYLLCLGRQIAMPGALRRTGKAGVCEPLLVDVSV